MSFEKLGFFHLGKWRAIEGFKQENDGIRFVSEKSLWLLGGK